MARIIDSCVPTASMTECAVGGQHGQQPHRAVADHRDGLARADLRGHRAEPARAEHVRVYIDAIARGEDPSRVRVNAVRFTPSARTAWHSHAVGQTLYVTEGRGLHRARDGQVEEIRPGDIIYTAADQWHWHGAAPDHFMTHLSITEAVPGDERPEAEWGEHVTDDEYNAR